MRLAYGWNLTDQTRRTARIWDTHRPPRSDDLIERGKEKAKGVKRGKEGARRRVRLKKKKKKAKERVTTKKRKKRRRRRRGIKRE